MTYRIGDNRVALTDEEFKALEDILKSGDRAGYYMAYYAMTGVEEALLQAKIASFSGAAGGAALAANRIDQDLFTPGTTIHTLLSGFFPTTNLTYAGIYYYSQLVAVQSLKAIDASRQNISYGSSKPFIPLGDGKLTDANFFETTNEAWRTFAPGGNLINFFSGKHTNS